MNDFDSVVTKHGAVDVLSWIKALFFKNLTFRSEKQRYDRLCYSQNRFIRFSVADINYIMDRRPGNDPKQCATTL